jgi:hypothetical protein
MGKIKTRTWGIDSAVIYLIAVGLIIIVTLICYG